MNPTLKASLDALLAKQTTFDKFVRDTRTIWQSHATQLRRRWRMPEAVEVQDIYQQLLYGVWEALNRYDPAKGEFASWAAWSAISNARRWINEQRNSLRRSGSAPGRYEFSESTYTDPESELSLEETTGIDRSSEIEDAICFRQIVELCAAEGSELDRYAASALRLTGYDEELAGAVLFRHRLAGGLPECRELVTGFVHQVRAELALY